MVLFTVPNYFKSVQMCVNRVFYDALNSIRDDHVFLIQLEQIGFFREYVMEYYSDLYTASVRSWQV